MASERKHPPSAACLSASMRDLGYSLETAIADLIDNSISAKATSVDIICDLSGAEPVVAILDNGRGMSNIELLDAMRHGTRNPKQPRLSSDLGRFGLGLKTASFSQCRSLTVVSRTPLGTVASEWNLDRIDEADEWLLSVYDNADICVLPYIDRLGDKGTLVLWRLLDRLFEGLEGGRRDEVVSEKIGAVGRHLSLVFHRYISGEVKGRQKLSIFINGHSIEAFDPFCRKNAATQVLPEEIVRLGTSEVRLQPYVLPHHSRLSVMEYKFYQDRSDFISNQGSYIYRNGRLMAWGDWFRLVPKGEATKLARVQIDFPNSLDEAWTIDIKKSRARPPHAVRERLRQVITKITSRSVTVHRGRGLRLFQEDRAPFWERYASNEGVRFVLNKQHPMVVSLISAIDPYHAELLGLMLDSIAATLPVEMIYSDYSTDPREVKKPILEENDAIGKLTLLKGVLAFDHHLDSDTFLQVVRSTRMFDGHEKIVEQFIRENFE